MTQTGDYVIETHGLSKTFGDVQALRGVDLNVPRHSIFGFLGPNGAGKTTLMKTLLGLSRPTSGSGTIFGYDIVHESVSIRERIGIDAMRCWSWSDWPRRRIVLSKDIPVVRSSALGSRWLRLTILICSFWMNPHQRLTLLDVSRCWM